MFRPCWESAQLRKHKAGQRGVFSIVDGEPCYDQNAFDLENGQSAVEEPGAVLALHGLGVVSAGRSGSSPAMRVRMSVGVTIPRRSVLVKHDRHVHGGLLERSEQLKNRLSGT